jgi:hypothetical protein
VCTAAEMKLHSGKALMTFYYFYDDDGESGGVGKGKQSSKL